MIVIGDVGPFDDKIFRHEENFGEHLISFHLDFKVPRDLHQSLRMLGDFIITYNMIDLGSTPSSVIIDGERIKRRSKHALAQSDVILPLLDHILHHTTTCGVDITEVPPNVLINSERTCVCGFDPYATGYFTKGSYRMQSIATNLVKPTDGSQLSSKEKKSRRRKSIMKNLPHTVFQAQIIEENIIVHEANSIVVEELCLHTVYESTVETCLLEAVIDSPLIQPEPEQVVLNENSGTSQLPLEFINSMCLSHSELQYLSTDICTEYNSMLHYRFDTFCQRYINPMVQPWFLVTAYSIRILNSLRSFMVRTVVKLYRWWKYRKKM